MGYFDTLTTFPKTYHEQVAWMLQYVNASKNLEGIVSGAITPDHNSLSGLDGGAPGEYNHLSDLEYTGLSAWVSENPADYSLTTHNHDASYAALSHNHDLVYAPIVHNHDASYAALSHNHSGADITSGTVGVAYLPALGVSSAGLAPATGTPSGKFLKDDLTWDTPAGGSSVWTLSGSNIYYTGGQVGIGTSSPDFDLQVGDYSTTASAVLGIVAASNYNSYIYLREVDANYGFSIGYEGTPNNFVIKRHNGSASGNVVFQIPRTSNDIYIGGPLTLMNGDNSTGSNNFEQVFFGYNGTTTYRHAIKTRHGSNPAENAIDFWLYTFNTAGSSENEPAMNSVSFVGDGSYIFRSQANTTNGPNLHLNNYQGNGYTSLLFTSGSAASTIQGSILFGPSGSNNIRFFGGASASNPVLLYNSSAGAWVPNSHGQRWGNTSLGWWIHYSTLTNASDARIKKNIRPSRGLDFIMKLKPHMFEYGPYTVREDEKERVVEQQGTYSGFIAQDFTDLVDPEEVVVQYDKDTDLWGMDITQLIAPLVQAVQDQQQIINDLKERL